MVGTAGTPPAGARVAWRVIALLTATPCATAGWYPLRLKVKVCGICRTDLHVVEGDLPPRRMPVIPGHQIVGVVERLGPGVTGVKAGERVGVAWLHQTCGKCRFCKSGRENLCEQAAFTGYDFDGGYAEYALADERFAYPLPGVLDDVDVAPLLCAGIIGYRALVLSGAQPGQQPLQAVVRQDERVAA